jgi:cytoskeletal protein CcmA (bactofilin family)
MAVFRKTEEVKRESYPSSDLKKTQKVSYVGKTMAIKGRIRAAEEIIVEGKIDGNTSVKHRVIVGKSGMIKGDIEASEVVIQGKVDGNVRASSKVEIVPEGTLNGNIVSQRVVLAEGAIFKGNIDMSFKEDKKPEPGVAIRKDSKETKEPAKK